MHNYAYYAYYAKVCITNGVEFEFMSPSTQLIQVSTFGNPTFAGLQA